MSGKYNNKAKSKEGNAHDVACEKNHTSKNKAFSNRQILQEIDAFVNRHGHGEGKKRTGQIRQIFERHPEYREYLIKAIKRKVLHINPKADRVSTDFECSPERILKKISYRDFVLKKYENIPYLLKKKDFHKMMNCKKAKIVIKGSKLSPVYKFENNLINPFTPASEPFTNNYVNTNFYFDNDKRMVFAKHLRQTFKIRDNASFLRNFDKPSVEHDEIIAERGLSASMFCLLGGSEKSLSLFARIDDEGYTHKNLFIDQYKKEVFGEVAGYPHFHFQNEEDQFVCRKNSINGYETGRCNAIDIPHLINYLYCIEHMPKRDLLEMYNRGLDHDMPFLEMLVSKRNLNINFSSLFKDLLNEENLKNSNFLIEFLNHFAQDKDFAKIKREFPFFAEFVFGLEFLQVTSDCYHSNPFMSNEKKESLSKVEILLFDKFIDIICNVENMVCRDNKKKIYTLENDFDDNFVPFSAI